MRGSSVQHDYRQALAFIVGRINYERTSDIPYRSREFKLDRMFQLAELIGSPHTRFPVVHVAGTKGKGSTATLIAEVLRAAGYRTGLYTSPHLNRIEERFVVDGQTCSPQALVRSVACVRPAIETLDGSAEKAEFGGGPTYFETTTAMAFDLFARAGVDVAVMEVGLGGRLDSTNICHPLVSVITSISFDHMAQLGNTLAAIAGEKAGIIKQGVPIICGETKPEPQQVIAEVAAALEAPLIQADRDYQHHYHPPQVSPDGALRSTGVFDFTAVAQPPLAHTQLAGIPLRLLGPHQARNAATATAALLTAGASGLTIGEKNIRRGISSGVVPARTEMIARRPAMMVDAAHNLAAVESLLATIDELGFDRRRRTLVFATTADKDVEGMLRMLLPSFQRVVFTQYENNPRRVPPGELLELAKKIRAENNGSLDSQSPQLCESPATTHQWIASNATPDEFICITGSFFIAAEMRALLCGRGA